MGAIRLVFRSELRRRWRSWLSIVVLIAIVSGLVLAGAAAGRRTASAFPRFVAAHGFDAVVYSNLPAPGVAKLAMVRSVTEVIIPDAGTPTCACSRPMTASVSFGVEVVLPGGPSPVSLVSGHMPDPSLPDQVLASFTLQQDFGVHIGSVIRVPFEAPSQAADYNNPNTGLPIPRGPTLAMKVVGIEATEFEFPSGTTPVYLLDASSAFERTVLPKTAVEYQYFVRLRHGAADIPAFANAAKGLNLGTGNVGYSSEDGEAATIEASIHPQAVGWWILAALAALVGLAVVGQAMARQSLLESGDYPTMAAIGVKRRQLVALGMARTLAVGVGGALGAIAIAFVLSPISPLGEARTAEIANGLSFDALVLPLGGLATVVCVLALGVWPSVKVARDARLAAESSTTSRSVVVARLTAMGAPPSAVIGVHNALGRRSGGAGVPLGSALLGVVLAVTALCGTSVFGASLTHLTATSRLWGDPEQVSLNPQNPALIARLLHDPAVAFVTEGVGGGELSIDNILVGTIAATAIKGPLLFSLVNGHLPVTDDQIGLGEKTMRLLGVHIGSDVTLSSTHAGVTRSVPFQVVSQESFPEIGGFVSLGTGALVTTAGIIHAFCPPGPEFQRCKQAVGTSQTAGLRVSFVPGPKGAAALQRYLRAYPSIAALPLTPTSLVNFGQAVNFPLIFGAMLALFGVATLMHLLIVTVSRRRREVGLLKVLGFVNGQVVASVAWQATTLAVVGVVVGVPLGILVGKAVWTAFANNLGVVPVAVVPSLLIGTLAGGVIVAANLLAVAPALVATRSKPADLLRASLLDRG